MIVVNSSTRQFNIPGADLVFGVTADGGSEIKYFQCPRYVGNNVDIASSFVRINYRNANGEIDYHLIEDVSVDGDNVLFSWELHEKVTAYKGQVSFVMCVVGADTKVKWHTTLGKGQVLEGLEPDWESTLAETDDGLAQLLAMVEAQTEVVENKGAEWVRNVQSEGTDQIIAVQTAARESREAAVAEIEAKGVNVRESIPEDYTSLENTVDGLVRGRVGAIVCEAAGSAVVVNDASDMKIQSLRIFGRSTQDGTPTPDAPVEIKSVVEPVVTVCGKNLLNIETLRVTLQSDGSYLLPTYPKKSMIIFPNGYAGQMTIGGWIKYESADNRGGYIMVQYTDGTDDRVGVTNPSLDYQRYEFTTRGDKVISEIGVSYGVGTVATYFKDVQVEFGTIATSYEPYSGQTVSITHTLPGIPVTSGGNYTDSDGQQWICDEVDLERGVYVQRISDIELESAHGMTYNSNDGFLYYSLNPYGIYGDLVHCTHFNALKFNGNGSSLKFPGFSSADEFKTFVTENEVRVLYRMKTPLETALSETEIAAYRALHSNYPNTTVLNDSGAHMVVKYAADTKLYIDNKIAALVGG